MKTYDEALSRAETIVKQLESATAISVADYKKQAEEAKALLDFCESQIRDMEKQLS